MILGLGDAMRPPKNKQGKDGFPFGLQFNPGPQKTGIGSFLYSLGIPVFSGGKMNSIYQDQMMLGNYAPGMGGGNGKARNEQPPVQQEQEPQINWSFPQYSQSWAFTPPVAPPYIMPPPFDKKKYK